MSDGDTQRLISLEGLPHKVESLLGRPIEDADEICGRDFACLNDALTAGDVMVAIRRTLRSVNPNLDHGLSADWDVTCVDDTAALVLQVARRITGAGADEDAIENAAYFTLFSLHGLLSHKDVPPYDVIRIERACDRLFTKLRAVSTQEDLNRLVTTAHTLHGDAVIKIGKSGFRYFPSTMLQTRLIAPSDDADATQEEKSTLAAILADRHNDDGCVFRLDDEVLECLTEAKSRVAARMSRRDRFEAAMRKALVEVGLPATANMEFMHRGDLNASMLQDCRISVTDGPVPGSLSILILPADTSVGDMLGSLASRSGIIGIIAKRPPRL